MCRTITTYNKQMQTEKNKIKVPSSRLNIEQNSLYLKKMLDAEAEILPVKRPSNLVKKLCVTYIVQKCSIQHFRYEHSFTPVWRSSTSRHALIKTTTTNCTVMSCDQDMLVSRKATWLNTKSIVLVIGVQFLSLKTYWKKSWSMTLSLQSSYLGLLNC